MTLDDQQMIDVISGFLDRDALGNPGWTTPVDGARKLILLLRQADAVSQPSAELPYVWTPAREVQRDDIILVAGVPARVSALGWIDNEIAMVIVRAGDKCLAARLLSPPDKYHQVSRRIQATPSGGAADGS